MGRDPVESESSELVVPESSEDEVELEDEGSSKFGLLNLIKSGLIV